MNEENTMMTVEETNTEVTNVTEPAENKSIVGKLIIGGVAAGGAAVIIGRKLLKKRKAKNKEKLLAELAEEGYTIQAPVQEDDEVIEVDVKEVDEK